MTRAVDRLVLKPVLSSVARARAFIGEVATLHALDPVVKGDAALVVSELVTNAVLHAGTTVELSVSMGASAVLIEVSDTGTMPLALPWIQEDRLTIDEAFDEPVDEDLDAVIDALSTTGRGMEMVAAIAGRWGVTAHAAGGKTVWAEVDLAPSDEVHQGGRKVQGTLSDDADDAAGTFAPGTLAPGALAPGALAPGALTPGEGALDAAGRPAGLRLAAVPVRLLGDSDRNLEETLRELQVMGLSDDAPPHIADLALAAAGVAEELRGVRRTISEAVHLGVERGDRLIDLRLEPDAVAPKLMRKLDAVLAAVAVARSTGRLLAMGPSEEVLSFRLWLRDELQRQAAGAVGRACPFPAVRPSANPQARGQPLSQRRQALLVALDVDLAGSNQRDEVATIAAGRVVAETGATFVNLLLLAGDRTHLSSVHRVGHPPGDPVGLFYDMGDDDPAPEAVRTAEPVVLRTRAERVNRYPAVSSNQELADHPTSVWVPLGRPAPADGVLVVGFPRARDFSDADLDYLLAFGEVIHRRLRALAPAE